MSENGTGRALVATARPAQRLHFARTATETGFLSQLIAARQHLAPQRARRRAPPGEAVDAYATGSRIAVVRLPIGYRTTRIV